MWYGGVAWRGVVAWLDILLGKFLWYKNGTTKKEGKNLKNYFAAAGVWLRRKRVVGVSRGKPSPLPGA